MRSRPGCIMAAGLAVAWAASTEAGRLRVCFETNSHGVAADAGESSSAVDEKRRDCCRPLEAAWREATGRSALHCVVATRQRTAARQHGRNAGLHRRGSSRQRRGQ